MAKKIDLTKSVYELVSGNPELIDIMKALGFSEITKKGMLNSVGKLMTIPKGAKMKHIPMEQVVAALMAGGFELEGNMPSAAFAAQAEEGMSTNARKALGMDGSARNGQAAGQSQNAGGTAAGNGDGEKDGLHVPENDAEAVMRMERLKDYLRRLGAGEDLEKVRADFVAHFSDVDAAEIMKAEQDLMKEGTPLADVQRLCDLHSALFHGATKEEKIANAEKAVSASLMRQKAQEEHEKQKAFPKKDYGDKKLRAAALEAVIGHPLHLFTKENDALADLIARFRETHDEETFSAIRGLSIHYAKKGDLLYPHLKVKYGVSGPSDVMWTVDDEIRDELGRLAKEERNDDWYAQVEAVLKRAEEMIYKEQNILFPICAVNFTEEEWFSIYQDSKDYAVCFGAEHENWPDAEAHQTEKKSSSADDEIVMPGGHMNVAQLTALLNTIPMEISFIDADNINRFFNEGPKLFKRPGMAIDREVFSCHPPKIEPMVRAIIDDFRSGARDQVPVWMEKNGRTVLVTYMAVRDRNGAYLGTAEFVQDMTGAKEHFLGKN